MPLIFQIMVGLCIFDRHSRVWMRCMGIILSLLFTPVTEALWDIFDNCSPFALRQGQTMSCLRQRHSMQTVTHGLKMRDNGESGRFLASFGLLPINLLLVAILLRY